MFINQNVAGRQVEFVYFLVNKQHSQAALQSGHLFLCQRREKFIWS